MADRMSHEEWATAHHKEAQDHLRHQLAAVLELHLPLAGQSGFLSLDEISHELTAAIAVVSSHKPEGPQP